MLWRGDAAFCWTMGMIQQMNIRSALASRILNFIKTPKEKTGGFRGTQQNQHVAEAVGEALTNNQDYQTVTVPKGYDLEHVIPNLRDLGQEEKIRQMVEITAGAIYGFPGFIFGDLRGSTYAVADQAAAQFVQRYERVREEYVQAVLFMLRYLFDYQKRTWSEDLIRFDLPPIYTETEFEKAEKNRQVAESRRAQLDFLKSMRDERVVSEEEFREQARAILGLDEAGT